MILSRLNYSFTFVSSCQRTRALFMLEAEDSFHQRTRKLYKDFLLKNCLNTFNFFKIKSGGDQDRTGDPLLAKQMLSQLSYAPKNGGPKWIRTTDPSLIRAVL